MTQPLDLDQIDTVIAAATPGPWCTDGAEIYQGDEYLPGLSAWIGETCRADESDGGKADAAYIAAMNPETAKAMAAEIRRLHAELAAEQAQHATTLRQRNNRSERLLHLRNLANAGDTEQLLAAARDTLAASVNDHRSAAEERNAVADDSSGPGTLPAWLYQRFAVGHIHPFEELDEANRSYWDHEARAVRRAVARGGFKTDPARP